MADAIRRVAYYYATVPNRPGEGARVLRAFKEAGVNLLAFHGFPSGDQAQLDLFPEDDATFTAAAQRAGLNLSARKTAFLIEGDDRVGAIHDILDQLGAARVNVIATDAMRVSGGRYGALLWVSAADADKAARTLGV